MIEGKQYITIVKNYCSFLMSEFNMIIIDEIIRGNTFYDIHYSDNNKRISISYENIEGYFQVIIFILQNGKLPDYEDKTKTLHLNILNKKILSTIDKKEINLNNEYFSSYKLYDDFEKKIMKSVKELRLCLKHFNEYFCSGSHNKD
jgi:hypothetical protein